MDTDLGLLARWRAGDKGAGEEIFARHYDGIRRFFENKVGGEADDLVQRTFVGCLEARDQFRGEASFRTYLFSIARNVLYSHLRNRQGRGEVDFNVSSLVEMGTSPSSVIDRQRRGARLQSALRELPLEQQVLLELHYWHDMDAAELASMFEVPAGTIRVRLHRARTALRDKLAGLAPEGDDRLSLAVAAPEEGEIAQ